MTPRSHPHRLVLSLLTAGSLALFCGAARPAAPALAGSSPAAEATPLPDPFAHDAQPVLKQFCLSCHGGKNPAAGIGLDRFKDLKSARADAAIWRRVIEQVRQIRMPPPGASQPGPAERIALIKALSESVLDQGNSAPDPGSVVMHRLNRFEYNNTVRDLFGVSIRPADDFPLDGSGGGGFDNNADTLFLPPVLMERYLTAADRVLAAADPRRLFFVRPSGELTPQAAARQVLQHFGWRAYRRPVDANSLARLMRVYQFGFARHGWEAGVRLALKAVLISPRFLFRAETRSDGARPLDDYELASRLSYFLWSSTPDDELLSLARIGRLHEPIVLEQQVVRMLQDSRSSALGESFAGQWLRTRELYTTAQPDPGRFPQYGPRLRDAFFQESALFFTSLLRDDSSLLQLIDANYTYANEELAKLYGIKGVTGAEMQRVRLTNHQRGGVLSMAGVLTVTSYPERTSPVLRGKWVLEQILGTPAPPPPPNAGGLSADDSPRDGMTFRQRLELHRKKPECASCHSRMDPLGFGLENFDGIGRWRTEIGGKPVDSSGVLVTGEKFSGPEELKRCLMAQKERFSRNLAEKMLSYALGRGLEFTDTPAVDEISKRLEQDHYRAGTLVKQIVLSYPFRYRKDRQSS